MLTGLPVAGFTGSLANRFDDRRRPGAAWSAPRPARLTGVSALAGIATDQAGTPLVFVLVADADRVLDDARRRAASTTLAAGLGACRCSR